MSEELVARNVHVALHHKHVGAIQPANLTSTLPVDAMARTFTPRAKHTYLVILNASVMCDHNAGGETTHTLICGGQTIASAWSRTARQNFAALAGYPLQLIGTWMAPSTADATVTWRAHRPNGDWSTWPNNVASNALHQLIVLDLGEQ